MRSISSVVNCRLPSCCDAAPAVASLALAASAAGWRRNWATTQDDQALQHAVATNVARWPLDAEHREQPVATNVAVADEMKGMKSAVPPPKPAAMMPEARPRRSLNHFSAEPIDPL